MSKNDAYIKPGTPTAIDYYRTIGKRLDFIRENMVFCDDDYLLDIGSGNGIFIDELVGQVDRYVCMDINKNYLKNAGDKNIDNILSDAMRPGFKEGSFDHIIMIEVLEHIRDGRQAIKEAFRVLKPGGDLIITAPNRLFPIETHGMHIKGHSISSFGLGIPFLPWCPMFFRKITTNVHVYMPREFTRLLAGCGLKIKNIEFISPGLDSLEKNASWLRSPLRTLGKWMDNCEDNRLLSMFMPTMIINAQK